MPGWRHGQERQQHARRQAVWVGGERAGVIEKPGGKKKRRRRIPLRLLAALLRPMNNASPQRRSFRMERSGFAGELGPRRPATATIGCAFGLSNGAAGRK